MQQIETFLRHGHRAEFAFALARPVERLLVLADEDVEDVVRSGEEKKDTIQGDEQNGEVQFHPASRTLQLLIAVGTSRGGIFQRDVS